jgi:hypothetical protein
MVMAVDLKLCILHHFSLYLNMWIGGAFHLMCHVNKSDLSCGIICHVFPSLVATPMVVRQLMWADDEYASHTNSNILCTSNNKQICYKLV